MALRIFTDNPIGESAVDELNRGPLVEQLCRLITGWKQRDSLVIALYGPWGSGKTSVKNLVVEKLRQASPQTLILEFSPWQWVGHDELSAVFFRELGVTLGTEKGRPSDAAKKMRRYGALLNVGHSALERLPAAASIILVFLSVVGLASVVAPEVRWITASVFVITIAGAILGGVSSVVPRTRMV